MAYGRNNSKRNNPNNSKNLLFRQLTRLLSGPIVNYRRQAPRQGTRRSLDKYRIRSASGQQFKKSEFSPYASMQADYMANQARTDRYVDFDQMEYTPEIASGLDIYSDEMTTSTNLTPLLTIKCPNEEIKNVLDTLYHNVLNVDFNLFGWCRSMCKYGDFFLYLDMDDKDGIKFALGLPPQEIERLEGEDKTNPNYVQFQWNSAGLTLENWQVAHFRILGNDKYAPYGTSVLEPARRIWRQLTLLEDAMMAYRIVRSPERRVFYVDVGNINPQDIEQYMQKVMTQMKRNQVVDKDSGRIDLRYNPMSIEEDYFVPVRGGVSTKIETLQGGQYTGDIDDVKYLRDKLFSALKIPASYLSRGEGGDEDKTTLAQKDIRFARTVQRLQRSVLSELEKIGVVHLFTLGYRGVDLTDFSLTLNNPSKIAELQELEHWKTKFDTAASANEGYFSRRWVSEKLFNLPEEEFLRMQREMFYDKKFDASLEKAVEQTTAGGAEGGDIGGLGGDLGGDLGGGLGGDELGGDELGGDEMTGEMEGGEPGVEAGAGEDEGMLLAAPGKRDENWHKKTSKDVMNRPKSTTTSKSKGKWYNPVTVDKRDSGARKRNYNSQWGVETASSTERNIFKGYQPLKSLGKGIMAEDVQNEQEREVLKTNYEIDKLIKEMESKNE